MTAKIINQGFRILVLGGVFVGAVVSIGCKTSPPPPPIVENNPPPQPIEDPPLQPVDDIPISSPPAIRAHLIKLRELRDQGKISPSDYESRKSILLENR